MLKKLVGMVVSILRRDLTYGWTYLFEFKTVEPPSNIRVPAAEAVVDPGGPPALRS